MMASAAAKPSGADQDESASDHREVEMNKEPRADHPHKDAMDDSICPQGSI